MRSAKLVEIGKLVKNVQLDEAAKGITRGTAIAKRFEHCFPDVWRRGVGVICAEEGTQRKRERERERDGESKSERNLLRA
jgi:hypothetical protein